MLGTMHILAHLVFPRSLGGRDDYHSHFTDDETGSEMKLVQGLAQSPPNWLFASGLNTSTGPLCS